MSTTIASWTRRLSLSLLMLGCLSNPSLAQAKAEIVGSPSVNEDRVTVRVKVTRDGKPIADLTDTDFGITVDDKAVDIQDWKSPEEAVAPPAWMIVLLDFSGSMQQPDSRGTTKFQGAINAIREFIDRSAQRSGEIQVAIIPFGEGSDRCNLDPVDNDEALDKFFPVGDFKVQNYLDHLEGQTPCASTNLYEPLNRAIRFLANDQDPRFHVPEESPEPDPRLSIILLSDGYHNASNEEQDFNELKRLLGREEIIVHTLGYGLTPEQLGTKYGLGRPATRQDLGEGNGKVPFEEFVDQKRLAEIAQLTGGIAEFSGNDAAIAQSLQTFLNALLGEYEITYIEPNPERGSKHRVGVNVNVDGAEVQSEPKTYITPVFGRSLPLPVRLTMLGGIFLAIGLGGVVPFRMWAQKLKYQGMDD